MKSNLAIGRIEIVIPRTQIPIWFNKINVGSSISMDPLPVMPDTNLIGVACCLTFVAHDHPTSLGKDSLHHFGISVGFRRNYNGSFHGIPIYLGKDLVTVELDHMLLIFFTREGFIDYTSYISKGLHDVSGIELAALVNQPPGLRLEVKNCGYHWIFKEDLEHLNPEMMYSGSGNSSVQIKYVTNA
jgi:hypothetical protein